MTPDPAAVRLRISAPQMAAIWPGLDRIVLGYSGYCKTGRSLYSFRSRLHHPSAEFNRGRFDRELMDQILNLWKRLRPQANHGGRIYLNAIEIRAAILAVRVEVDWWRLRKHEGRKHKARTKERLGIDPESLRKIEKRASRTIRSLERHMKRANYQLRTQLRPEAYAELMSAWLAHVRWMRLHLVHFRPLKPILSHSKARYQLILDELEDVARIAIPEEGYELPTEKQLRCAMRLFARSSRRGRRRPFDVGFILKNRNDMNGKAELAEFVIKRFPLKPLTEKN